MSDNGSLSATFLYYWRALDGPELEQEYKAIPGRQFRFDFAAPLASVAIDLDGGTWAKKGAKKCKFCGEIPQGQHGRGGWHHQGQYQSESGHGVGLAGIQVYHRYAARRPSRAFAASD